MASSTNSLSLCKRPVPAEAHYFIELTIPTSVNCLVRVRLRRGSGPTALAECVGALESLHGAVRVIREWNVGAYSKFDAFQD